MRYVLIVLAITLSACAIPMRWFPLPADVAVIHPGPQASPDLSALSGVWTGTWLSEGWPGFESLLVVERIEPKEGIVVYAWANNPWDRNAQGWIRQKVRVVPGPGIEWQQGDWKYVFQLEANRRQMSGTLRINSSETAWIRLDRAAYEAPSRGMASKPAPRPMPPVPAIGLGPPTPGLAPELASFLGMWEGTWDSGISCRLAVRRIDRDSAMIVYMWSDHPNGGFKAGRIERSALVRHDERKLVWGGPATFTFQIAKDGGSVKGEWELNGMLNRVDLKRVAR